MQTTLRFRRSTLPCRRWPLQGIFYSKRSAFLFPIVLCEVLLNFTITGTIVLGNIWRVFSKFFSLDTDSHLKGHDTRWNCIPRTLCLQARKIYWQKRGSQRRRQDPSLWIRAKVISFLNQYKFVSRWYRVCVGKHVASATVGIHHILCVPK